MTNYRNKNGFADTKKYPHRNHPASYRRLNKNDDIEYITYTHHDVVSLKDKKIKTIPMNSNINEIERKKGIKSYAYPKVYVGKRSALGKERKDYSFTFEDKKFSNELYKTLPREHVKYSSKAYKSKFKK